MINTYKRILEIPTKIKQIFPGIRQIWKYENEIDFMDIMLERLRKELHYLLNVTRASVGGYAYTFEVRGIIETHKKDLQDTKVSNGLVK